MKSTFFTPLLGGLAAIYLLTACTANNYVLTSPNNPFIDSSKTANAKFLTSFDSKQLQATVRVYDNLVAMGDVFLNNSANDTSSNLSRFAYNFGLAYNFHPIPGDPLSGFSVGLGAGGGETDYRKHQILLSDWYNTSSQYQNYFLQLGALLKAGKTFSFVFLYKANYVHFNSYHYAKYNEEWFGYDDEVPYSSLDFMHKNALVHDFSFTCRIRTGPYIYLLFDQGYSNSTGFNAKAYIRNDYPYSSFNDSNRHPYQLHYYFRVGVQVNFIKRGVFKK